MQKITDKADIKRKTLKSFMSAFFLLALISFFVGVGTPEAFSAQADSVTVLDADTTTASSGCIYLGVYGTYYSDAQAALDRINEIRYEACVEGVPNPNDPTVALTVDDYVPLKWSSALEQIARTRAVEAAFTINHKRLNDKSIFTVSFDGLKSVCEDLAWDYVCVDTMVYGVNLWYSEKSDWLAVCEGTISSGSVQTGHYTSMINPLYTYIGLGDFYTNSTYYTNTTAAAFSKTSVKLDQTMLSEASNVIKKVEVKESYIQDYYIDAPKELAKGGAAKLQAMANVKYGSYSGQMYCVDDISYTSSDTSILMVDSDGTATGLAYGKATVTAYYGSTAIATVDIFVNCAEGCNLGSYDKNYKVSGTCNICGNTVSYTVPSYVDLYFKNSTTEGTEYSSVMPDYNPVGSYLACWLNSIDGDAGYQDVYVSCSNPELLSVPEKMTTTSIYNFEVLGAGVVTLTLVPKYNPDLEQKYILTLGDDGSVDISDASVSISFSSKAYTGSAITPTASVSYKGTTLTKGVHYSVSYSNNVKPGTATVTITGKGIFKGTVNKTFTITHTTHSYKSKVTAPTYAKAGYTTYTCSVCGYSYTGNKTAKLTLAKPTVTLANATKGVKINWTKSSGADGYIIYRKTAKGTFTKIKTITSGSTVTYTDTTAKAGTTYYYTVKAYVKSGSNTYYSSYVTNKSIKYLKCPSVTLSKATKGVKVTWTKVTGASGYYIYRKLAGGSWTKLKTITSTSKVSYTDTSVKNGKTYYYTVKAYSGSSLSTYVTNKSIKYNK